MDEPRLPSSHGHYIPGVAEPQWQVPVRFSPLSSQDFLHDRVADPEQRENLWESEPGQRRRMLELLRKTIEEEGAPPEQFERLGLR